MVAARLQSIGYRQFYARVFAHTGIDILEDDMTSLFLCKEDAETLWQSVRRQKITSKINRMREHYRRLTEGVAKLKADNKKAFSYESGMMGPEGEDLNEDVLRPQEKRKGAKRKRTNDGVCVHSGLPGHVRISSFDCLKMQTGNEQKQTQY